MSTVIVNSSLSSMAPPRARLVTPQARPSSEGADQVQLSGLKASEEKPTDRTTSVSTRILAGMGLALAMGGALAACTGAVAAPMAPPPPPAITQTVQQVGIQPISPQHQELMKEVAAPSLTDNLTANQVRNRYGSGVEDAMAEATTFQELHTRLSTVGEKLQSYADQRPDGGSFVDNGSIIGVEKDSGRTTVTVEMPDSSVQESVRSRFSHTVRERDSRGNTVTMEETARFVKITENGVTRTYQRQSGDFEVVSEQGPRLQTRLTIDGASIRQEVKQTISGFAGDVIVTRTTSYEVPETSIMVYPRVLVTETTTTTTQDVEFGGINRESIKTEVYDNGSSRTIRKGGDGQEQIQEEGPAILIAGGR